MSVYSLNQYKKMPEILKTDHLVIANRIKLQPHPVSKLHMTIDNSEQDTMYQDKSYFIVFHAPFIFLKHV